MKNILLFLFMFLWMPTLMAEEISVEQLYQELGIALRNDDMEKIEQLVLDNPILARETQFFLEELGQSEREDAESLRAVAKLLGEMRETVSGEILPERFIEEFLMAIENIEKEGFEKVRQLFSENPNALKENLAFFEEAAQGEGKDAEQAKEILELLNKTQEMVLKYENEQNNILPEIFRLHKEGTQAYDNFDYSTALKKWEEGLELAQQIDYKFNIASFSSDIAKVYKILGQFEKSLDFYQQSMAAFKEINDEEMIGHLLGVIANVYSDLGEYDTALNYYEQSLSIVKKLGDANTTDILNNIGTVYTNLGQYSKALDYYEQSISIRRKLDDKKGEAKVLSNIGIVYYHLGEYSKALNYFEQILVIDKENGDKKGESGDLVNIGNIYSFLGLHNKALNYYEKALTIQRETGDRKAIATNLNNIGLIYWN